MSVNTTTRWIAHRGASHEAPENTLAAVDLAWQQDADAVEIDVRFTGDGRIVLMHDQTTGRTCDRDLEVAAATYDDLCQLDAGRWKGSRWSEEPVPLLEQVLASVPEGKKLVIEIKSGPEIVPALAEVVRGSGKAPGQVELIAFSLEVLKAARGELPDIAMYWLGNLAAESAPALEQWIRRACEAHLTGLDLHAGMEITAEAVERMQAAGLKVYVWTVDDPARARELVAAGVDGITSNRAAWLRKECERAGKACP